MLVLVPEIALSPQTARRFAARFGDQVAVLHSGISDGEGDLREQPSPDRPLADLAASADVFDRAFVRLTADERALLVLRHRDELPIADIASRLGIPAGTVKSRLFAARRTLERALAREDR